MTKMKGFGELNLPALEALKEAAEHRAGEGRGRCRLCLWAEARVPESPCICCPANEVFDLTGETFVCNVYSFKLSFIGRREYAKEILAKCKRELTRRKNLEA